MTVSCRAVWLVVAGPLLFSPVRGNEAERRAEAAALLSRAAAMADLRAEGGTPFQLRATFRLMDRETPKREAARGTYLLTWAGPDRWREEITFPGYREESGQDGATGWLRSNLPYRPLRVFDVRSCLEFVSRLAPGPSPSVRRVSERRRGGARLRCVHLEVPGRLQYRLLCLDPREGHLVYEEQAPWVPSGRDYYIAYRYERPLSWKGKQFPRRILRLDRYVPVTEVGVEEIAEANVEDRTLFAPPPGAVPLSSCRQEDLAVAAECVTMPVETTPSLSGHPRAGLVWVRAVVGRDGRLHDSTVVHADDFMLGGDVLKSLGSASCRPMTCSGTVVDGEAFLTWGFRNF